jgi:SAM-dependent methyltransferase
VEASHRESAERIRSQIESGLRDPSLFRAALLDVPPAERDEWVDCVFGLGELPDDGPELPKGCVPYLPCSVDALLRVVEHAPVRASDVFVDIGSGLGRAAALVHLLTGAGAICLEIQPRLVLSARDLAARLLVSRISCVECDAVKLTGFITIARSFLYCPFSGEHLAKVLGDLESIAHTRTIRVCCVDLPLPPCAWLTPEVTLGDDLTIYRSTVYDCGRPRTGGVRERAVSLPTGYDDER